MRLKLQRINIQHTHSLTSHVTKYHGHIHIISQKQGQKMTARMQRVKTDRNKCPKISIYYITNKLCIAHCRTDTFYKLNFKDCTHKS